MNAIVKLPISGLPEQGRMQIRRLILKRPEFLPATAAHLLVIISIVLLNLGLTHSAQASGTIFLTCPPAPSPIECPATPVFPEPTGQSDIGCPGGVTLTSHDTEVPGPCPGTKTVTRIWTATDQCGESGFCSQTVQVVDTTPPTITCAGPQTVECPTPPNFTNPTVSDACDPNPTVTFTDTTTAGTCPDSHNFTRTWTATDCSGNHASCSQTITVVDTTAPTITCPGPQTIQCPGIPSFSAPSVFDACDDSPTVTFIDVTTPGTCPQSYSVTRTWTATDLCGNAASCSQTITVVDTTPPTIFCPGDEDIVQCPQTPVFEPPFVHDACDPSPTVTFTETTTPGPCPQHYDVTRTWTATDHCGNSASCSETITVVDTTAPIITCPGPQTMLPSPPTPTLATPSTRESRKNAQ